MKKAAHPETEYAALWLILRLIAKVQSAKAPYFSAERRPVLLGSFLNRLAAALDITTNALNRVAGDQAQSESQAHADENETHDFSPK